MEKRRFRILAMCGCFYYPQYLDQTDHWRHILNSNREPVCFIDDPDAAIRFIKGDVECAWYQDYIIQDEAESESMS